MYEVVCILCAVKLEDKASRMYVWDRTSFSTEDELKNVLINVIGKQSVDRPNTTHIKAHGMVV